MDMESTGKMIAKARQEKGWTQRHFAEKIHLSDKAVSKWERGLSFPDISILPLISDVLKIPIQDLVMGKRSGGENNIENVVMSTVEVSKREIKHRSIKSRRIIAVLLVIATLIIIAMSVCLAIAFTPADGYTTFKKDYISAETLTDSQPYILPIKGRVMPYPPTRQTVKTRMSVDKIKDIVKKTVLENGDTIEYLTPVKMIIKRQNSDGAIDAFYFQIKQIKNTKYCVLNSMAHDIVVYDETHTSNTYQILFPTYVLGNEPQSRFRQSMEYQFDIYQNNYEFTTSQQYFYDSVDEVSDFYAQNPKFSVERDGYNEIQVHSNYELDAFRIEFEYKADASINVLRIYIID